MQFTKNISKVDLDMFSVLEYFFVKDRILVHFKIMHDSMLLMMVAFKVSLESYMY